MHNDDSTGNPAPAIAAAIDRPPAGTVASAGHTGGRMPYKIMIELSDRDLRHFRRELRREREALAIADD